MNRYVVLILAVSALVVFCGGEPTATPDSVATQVAVEKAAGATLPAEVPTLTEAPAPTATPEPTEGAAVVYLPEEARQALDDHIAEVEGPDFE